MTLRAALADLRHLEGLLAHVARDLTACDLDPADTGLLVFTSRVVLELHATIEGIDREFGPSPPAPALSASAC